MAAIAGRVEKALESVREPITVAIMGCMVNGPGESKEADIGVACGQGVGVLFREGRLSRRVPEAEAFLVGKRPAAELFEEAGKMVSQVAEPRATSIRGSPEYKRDVLVPLTARALSAAAARATANTEGGQS